MDNKKREEKLTLEKAISQAASLMVENPRVLNISLKKIEGKHTYNWEENDTKSKETRKQIKEILQKLWQSGSYNYQQIAEKLRVDVLAVQGLLDEDFLFKYPHLA